MGRGEQRGEERERKERGEKEREVKKKEKTRVKRRVHGAVWQHCDTSGRTCSFICMLLFTASPHLSSVQ